MPELFYAVISLTITVSLYLITKRIINVKLRNLKGSDKLVGLILIGIILGEVFYLGTSFGLFSFALELITSIGAVAVVLGIALQNQLKNTIAGISIFLNSQINVGDKIEFDFVRGQIIELHLTKTIAKTEDGEKMVIPNHKFSEEMVIVFPRSSK